MDLYGLHNDLELLHTKMIQCVEKIKDTRNQDADSRLLAIKQFDSIVKQHGRCIKRIGRATKHATPDDKAEGEKLKEMFTAKLAKMKLEVDTYRASTSSAALYGKQADSMPASNDEIMNLAVQQNSKTVEVARQAQRDAHEAVGLAGEVLATLEAQTEQLERINEKVHGFRGTIKRGNKVLQIYKRRIMTDRAIWILVFLIFAAIVALIIYATLVPDQSVASVPEEAKPPNPTTSSG